MTDKEKKEPMVQLVCQLPAELKSKIFVYAEVNDMSMAQVVRKVLREFFDDYPRDRKGYRRFVQKGTGHVSYIPEKELDREPFAENA